MGLKMVLLWQWRVALVLVRDRDQLEAITVKAALGLWNFILPTQTHFHLVTVDITVFNFNGR